MSNFFTFTGETESFLMFGTSHLMAVLVITVLLILMITFRKAMAINDLTWRRIFATVLITQELLLNVNRLFLKTWSWGESLPLHLCSFSVILISIMMLTESKKIFEFIYYWGIVGAIIALLTPNLSDYNFPHFRYYQFFLAHGMILLGTLYFVIVKQWLPGRGALLRTMIYTNVLLPVIGVVNWMTDGNYFFIARKLDTASPLDMLPDWPYYIVYMELIALGLFILLTIPVLIYRKKKEPLDVMV